MGPTATQTYLGPKVSQVLAAIYATHPTSADAAAFSGELALAHLNGDPLARTFARIALVDAFRLGRATIAYQLGVKRLNELDLAKVPLGSLRTSGSKSKRPLTINLSPLGLRILRLARGGRPQPSGHAQPQRPRRCPGARGSDRDPDTPAYFDRESHQMAAGLRVGLNVVVPRDQA